MNIILKDVWETFMYEQVDEQTIISINTYVKEKYPGDYILDIRIITDEDDGPEIDINIIFKNSIDATAFKLKYG